MPGVGTVRHGEILRTGALLGLEPQLDRLALKCQNLGAPPERIITDSLRSYGAALQQLPDLHGVEHLRVRSAARLNNRIEQSHLPTRLRERRMQRFKSVGSAQQFLSLFSRVHNLFRPRRHLLTAAAYRSSMEVRFHTWSKITGVVCA